MDAWRKLEIDVRNELEQKTGIKTLKYADVTEEHDGTGLELIIECKKTETASAFPIRIKEYLKTKKDSNRLHKDFVFVAENKDGVRIALMDWDRYLVFMATVSDKYGDFL